MSQGALPLAGRADAVEDDRGFVRPMRLLAPPVRSRPPRSLVVIVRPTRIAEELGRRWQLPGRRWCYRFPSMTTSAATWLERFADELGLEAPTEDEVEEVLALASVAAHASERTAAPISCWLAARSGLPFSAVMAIADALAIELGE